MSVSAENLRLILGLKLKRLRLDHKLSLKALAARSGLSVSYISEIEQGKKYPKPEKLIALSTSLNVSFDELVSAKVEAELMPLKSIFSSTFVQEFPFELFGLHLGDLFGIMREHPVQAWSLIRTFLEIGELYDVRLEHFLFAALRSYQQANANYFDELEAAAVAYRSENKWDTAHPIAASVLRSRLEKQGYIVDEHQLSEHPTLSRFRSVFLDGSPPKLLVNGRMLPAQKAFIYAREIGYHALSLKERAVTSSWLKVESFDQVFNNFKASYFAGALLIDQKTLKREVQVLFRKKIWDEKEVVNLVNRFGATPEMFFYRLTELLPALFGLKELFFVRFGHKAASDRLELTKVLNMSDATVPHGLWLKEHYCRRWPDTRLFSRLEAGKSNSENPLIATQRSHFQEAGKSYFVLSMARPLTIATDKNSCVSIGFLMDDNFKRTVKAWDDPNISDYDVNLTCERCGLSECRERVAEPGLFEAKRLREDMESALSKLVKMPG